MVKHRTRLATALVAGAAITGIVMVSQPPSAAILMDNFDSSTPTLNWAGDNTFQSIPPPGNVTGKPSVDLIGGNLFGNLAMPGNGNSVDLDGST
jgi:hypothetical protein